jgi:hypothetical protein
MKRTENKVILTESLGGFSWFIGGFLLFLGWFFLWLDTLFVGVVLVMAGLVFIGYRRKAIIDGKSKAFSIKWGLFIPMIEKKPVSLDEAKAVVIYKHRTRSTTKFRSVLTNYHIEIEFPNENIRVWDTYDSESGTKIITKIAGLLNIRYYHGSTTNM